MAKPASPAETPQPEASGHQTPEDGSVRRDFLTVTSLSLLGGFGVAAGAGLLNSWRAPQDVSAAASVSQDLSQIEEGSAITLIWQKKPVFIRHRTAEEIEAEQIPLEDQLSDSSFLDPQLDSERVQEARWLIVVGKCTHFGCVPLGSNQGESRGPYNGWVCPCHGSQYDVSGRVRKGPAIANLPVPPYRIEDEMLIIG